MADITTVIVVDEGLYVGGGLVDRWFKRMGNNLWHNVVGAAPQRTGVLKSLIDLDFTHEGLRILNCFVSSNAPYSKYVIGGTAENGAGYIYSRAGWAERDFIDDLIGGGGLDLSRKQQFELSELAMVLSDERGGRHLRVHGQRANNFLATGYNRTARTHRALHPIHPGFIT